MLQEYNDEELLKELEDRKKRRSTKPNQLVSQDFTSLREYCQDYIDELAKNQVVSEDQNQYIFEAAMEAVFGKEIWRYINSF